MKKFFLILVTISLLTCFLYAADKVKVRQEIPINDLDPDATSHYPAIPQTDDLFDFQFVYPVGVGGGEAGMECDGNYMYTTKWNGNGFYRYELDGTYIETFTVTGCPGNIRDLAWDGQYFYGGAATNTVYEMDFDTQTTISTINAPIAVRAIAYDEVNDGFWANNWSDPITLFDRSGNPLDSFNCGVFISYYGFAWENVLPDGPYLWGYSQGGPTTNQLVQFDIATGEETGVNFDIGSIFTVGTGIAGGLYISDALVPGKWTIGGTSQNTILWGVELADAEPPDAPGMPTDFAVIPDAGGALEAVTAWTCPSLTVSGNPLTELLEMRLYRDEDLIYTDTSPVIGGPGTYTDSNVPASGTYAYKIVGYNSEGEGIPAIINTWVGEDVPNVVEDLLLEQTAPGVLSGTLTWVNPTTGLNGGAFNEPILGYHIVRSDGPTFELAGIATTYVDDTIPAAGVYSYTVQAYNVIGDGGIETSNAVLIFEPGLLIMEDFSSGVFPPAGWYIDGLGQTNWTAPVSNNAGGVAPEAQFYWSPQFVGISRLVTMPVNTVGMTFVDFEFKHYLDHYGGGYTISVETTSDGSTWNTTPFTLVNPTGNVGPETQTITITNPDVGSATFQLGFTFNGDSFNLDWWNIDDVMLTGPTPDPGYITGTVTLDGGTGNVEDVEVTANGVTVNPDDVGFYEITIMPGTYDVTGTLPDYDPDTVFGVVVEPDLTTSGVDLTLVYNPALAPPENLNVECIDNYALFTWDEPDRDLLGYNVYLDGLFDGFTEETEYQFFGLINGDFYDAGVSALYDEGESEIIEINFEYTGTGAGDIIVATTELKNNYPNPFNPVTNIAFSLSEPGHVTLEVYNIKGEKVRTLINEVLPANNHVVTWNGMDDNNKSVASGVYFYKMKAEKYASTKKMILMK